MPLGLGTDAGHASGRIDLRVSKNGSERFDVVRVTLGNTVASTPPPVAPQPIAHPRAHVSPPAFESVPKHVNTADYVSAGDGGYTGSPGALTPYLTWANDPPASTAAQYAALGMKLYRYEDPFKAYPGNGDFTAHDLLAPNSAAIAHDCSGHEITFGGGRAIATDPRSPAAGNHFAHAVAHDAAAYGGVHFDAWFSDDTANVGGADNGYTPCGFSLSSWESSIRTMWQAGRAYGLPARVIFNGLNLALYNLDLTPLLRDPQVIGAMWESCYGGTNGFGVHGDYVNDLNKKWALIESSEIATVAAGKAFWCFNENANSSASSQAARLYAYSSFLLTYDPGSSVYETAYKTGSGAHVGPETGFVPLSPAITRPSIVSQLRQSSGVYARRYAACYVKGSPVGACAVVVNPDAASHAFPFAGQYGHTLTISGGGVLDGGSVTASGPAPPSVLGPVSAIIAIH